MNAIYNRRSIRKYQDKPIEKEKIELLLKAAMQAPSAGNQQPWEFIVVQSKERLQELSNVSPYSKMLAETPVAIVLLGNSERMKYPGMWEQDMGAATQNLLLQAADLGLGAVWLGVAPIEERMEYIKACFNLPDNMQPFAVVPVGYPAEENEFIDRFDESRVYYEEYKEAGIKMIKVVAKNHVQEGKIGEAVELYKQLVEMTRKEEGCISYELYQDQKNTNIITMIEEWESPEALDKHIKSEHFTRIVPMLKKLMAKETEMNVYNKLI